jgi:hypothetical protein
MDMWFSFFVASLLLGLERVGLLEQGGELARTEVLEGDVAPADKLAADEDLRDGRPVAARGR